MNEVSLKKISDILKTTRESKGLTIQEVSLATRINHRVLKAIEDADITNLPAKAFTKGFILNYSQLLKIDQETMSALIAETFPNNSVIKKNLITDIKSYNSNIDKLAKSSTPKNKESKESLIQHSNDKNDKIEDQNKSDLKPHTPPSLNQSNSEIKKTIGVGLFIMFLVGTIYILGQIVEKYTEEKATSNIENSISQINPENAITENSEKLLQNSDLNVESTQNSQSNPTSSPMNTNQGDSEVNPQMPSEAPTIAPVATPTLNPNVSPSLNPKQNVLQPTTPTVIATSSPKPSATPMPTQTASPTMVPQMTSDSKKIELIIEAKSDIEIQYLTKNGATGKFKLSKDQIHIFKSKNGLNITLSSGNSANIILNGKDLGTPGEKNKPLNLVY